MTGRQIRFASLALVASLACAPSTAAAGVASIDVAMIPATQTVAPGDTFTVQLRCTETGLPFNGFDLSVAYDPAVLTLMRVLPLSLQEGSLMRGACGNTFHLFQAAGDSTHITDVLLCASIALTGPGQLYVLRFIAGQNVGLTVLTFREVQFYNAGLFQGPVVTSSASVAIGSLAGVTPAEAHGSLRLRAAPNPGRGSVLLQLQGTGTGALDVTDVTGRVVRHLAAAGALEWRWDGTDEHGRPVAPGMYLAVARAGERAAMTRFVLLR